MRVGGGGSSHGLGGTKGLSGTLVLKDEKAAVKATGAICGLEEPPSVRRPGFSVGFALPGRSPLFLQVSHPLWSQFPHLQKEE